MIILDTNVVSEPLRPAPDQLVVQWLDAQIAETLFLTTVTVAELRFGIAALPPGRRRTGLEDRFEGDVLPLFAGRILGFDEPATREYAALRARARQQGLAIGDFDALIASIAKVYRFAVASRDVAPFVTAGVREVINPFA